MDRIRNYEQGVAEIETLTSMRSNLEVPATEYTPDESQPARDRVFTFAQEEKILSILGDIDIGVKNFVDKTNTNTENITENTANIVANTQAIATNASNIATNTANIATNTQNIAEHTTAITALTADVEANTTNIEQNAQSIETLTASIEANAANIATNTSNIATNTSNIATNTSNIATNAENIAQNTEDITANTTAITALTADVETNTTNIEQNAQSITEHSTAIVTNTQNISTNTADIATNTASIATNTADIANNTTDIDIAEKRISNIEKLLQGNLYDYQTDETEAYTKTVPAGAMPYAGIERIGGKTLVWNQLSSMIASSMVVTSNGVTFTFNSDELTCTLSGTASGANAVAARGVNVVKGHKYLLTGCPSGGGGSNYFQAVSGQLADEGNGSIFTEATGGTRYIIITVANGTNADGLVFRSQLFDLTLMFGSGNEPSTVQEFRQMFPASYYPYNAGTLLSAGVTEVESVGKNLLDAQTLFANVSSSVVEINGDEWDIKSPSTLNNFHVYDNTDGYTGQITVSYQKKDSGSSGSGYKLAFRYTDGSNEQIASPIHNSDFATYSKTSANGKVVRAVFGTYNQNQETYFKNVQIEKSATATEYTPYMETTMPIPAEVRNLEGYGWSAGNARNYIDFERKVYVKQVHAVDMGTLTWSGYDSTKNAFYKLNNTFNPAIKRPSSGYNVVCSRYTTVPTQEGNDKSICMPTGTGNFSVKDTETLGTTTSALSTLLAGVMLYYELATPIETDISAYLSDDNLIEVEASGTLTFPNSNGDDYRIPVPSTEEYMINLQEAVSNG